MNSKHTPTVITWVTSCVGVTLVLGNLLAAQTGDVGAPQDNASGRGDQQRLFDRINVSEAWEISKGHSEVLVGMIDNGYDFFHPDLKGQLIPGWYYSGGFHTEFHAGGAHGTQVASIIAAKDDGAGMVGLAPLCKVLTASQGMLEHALVKMRQEYFRDHPKATLSDWQQQMRKRQDELVEFGQQWAHYQLLGAADAIKYLVDHGARVINISGGMERSLCPSDEVWEQIEDAFVYAAVKDAVIVLAAGNNAAKWEGYPGKSDSVLVVGASLLDDTRWEREQEMNGMKITQGSNYGNRLSVMAPVDNLMVCQPHEERWYDVKDSPMGPMKLEFSGAHKVLRNGATSSAAPIVSSLAALILSVDSELDAKSVVEIVKQGCDDIGEPGYDLYTGHGRVNFGKTLELARSWKHN